MSLHTKVNLGKNPILHKSFARIKCGYSHLSTIQHTFQVQMLSEHANYKRFLCSSVHRNKTDLCMCHINYLPNSPHPLSVNTPGQHHPFPLPFQSCPVHGRPISLFIISSMIQVMILITKRALWCWRLLKATATPNTSSRNDASSNGRTSHRASLADVPASRSTARNSGARIVPSYPSSPWHLNSTT